MADPEEEVIGEGDESGTDSDTEPDTEEEDTENEGDESGGEEDVGEGTIKKEKRKKKELATLPEFVYEPKETKQHPVGGEYEKQLQARIERERLEEERKGKAKKESRTMPEVHRAVLLEDQPRRGLEHLTGVAGLEYREGMPDRYLEACTRQYRDSVWLNTDTRRVDRIYTNNIEYGLERDTIVYNGLTWYPVSEAYFRLQCKTRSDKKEVQGNSFIFTKNDGTVVVLNVLYHFTDGTYAPQDIFMYRAEINYFVEMTANDIQRRDLLTSRPFTLEDNRARTVGKDALAGIPESEAVELSIANLPTSTNRDYLENIASLTAFMLDDSVFKQRLKLGYYVGVDISRLPSNEKADYLEEREYYTSMIRFEVDRLAWELFDIVHAGEKMQKRQKADQPQVPVIQDKNTDGTKVFYNGVIYDIATLHAQFASGNIVLNGTEAEQTFVQKINRMNLSPKTKTDMKVIKPKLNIFKILEASLENLRNNELTKLNADKEVCDYCSKHVGENSQFKSVMMDDSNQIKIVNFCSTNCFEKTKE